MVDHPPAPFAFHVQPSEMVCQVWPRVDGDPALALVIQRAGNLTDSNRSSHALEPSKFPGFPIVMQQLAQPRAGYPPRSSHDDLAKWKRAAPAALEGRCSNFRETRSSGAGSY